MKFTFVEIKELQQAENCLHVFSDCLNSLSQGPEYIHNMAEKFIKYGKIIAAVKDNNYISFAAFYANDSNTKTAFLSMIAVSQNYRHMHLGSETLIHCEKISKECGMNRLRLEVNSDNFNAIKFYKNHGYKSESIKTTEAKKSYFMYKIL